jgi:CBS domain containing-hemolysin-like protein
VDAFAVPDDLTHDELIPRLREKRYRRVPVYGETPDDIEGVLDVRAFLLNTDTPYTEQLVAPSFVPETMKAIDLLRSFLKHPQGLAIVVDEHGGTEGIVTLADIIEEIISETVAGGLIVNGSARLDDLNEMLSVKLVEEGIDTIGGLLFNRLGSLPKPGTEVKIDDLTLTVRRTSRKRVEELFIALPETLPPGEEEET